MVGSVIEDTIKKNWELWLVLQDMQKAYNSVVGIGANVFRLQKGIFMVSVLGESRFVRCLPSLQCYGVAFVD
ncbi:hypothetical protein G9A89_006226 [Geosiphon pyriformis]|nr:hypothetical protein G9A89_006226 [Geosiphon pyriformis]